MEGTGSLASKSRAARNDLRLLLLPFLLLAKILPFDPLRRVGGSLAFGAGAVPEAVDSSFDDVRDGIFRTDVFFFGASAETALPWSEATCGWVTGLSVSTSLTVVASWTVSIRYGQKQARKYHVGDTKVV